MGQIFCINWGFSRTINIPNEQNLSHSSFLNEICLMGCQVLLVNGWYGLKEAFEWICEWIIFWGTLEGIDKWNFLGDFWIFIGEFQRDLKGFSGGLLDLLWDFEFSKGIVGQRWGKFFSYRAAAQSPGQPGDQSSWSSNIKHHHQKYRWP